MTVDLAYDVRAELGEGPMWHPARQRLFFLDITAGRVHEFDPRTGADRTFELGMPVGAVAPTADGGLVAAAQDGFYRVDLDSGRPTAIAPIPHGPGLRINDGNVDARGRFWAGTLANDRTPTAALYRLDADGRVSEQLSGVINSNGIDWSPDSRLLYYVDTGTRRVDVFDFALDAGTFANRRPFVDLASETGKPDGLIVDADGGVWVALWGGGQVRRYRPDGRLDLTIDVPAPHTTKCAFGGPELTDLYITTAWTGMSDEARAACPRAGSLFHCRPGQRGQPARAARLPVSATRLRGSDRGPTGV